MDKKAKNTDKEIFNINYFWRNALCSPEEYNEEDCIKWFDRKKHDFTIRRFFTDEQEKAFSAEPDRFVKLFQIIEESLYKGLVETINNKAVRDYFNSSQNRDEIYKKYRMFIDWNDLYSSERYREYLHIYPLMIDWCTKNNIEYIFEILSKPNNYIYDDVDKFKNTVWELPRY